MVQRDQVVCLLARLDQRAQPRVKVHTRPISEANLRDIWEDRLRFSLVEFGVRVLLLFSRDIAHKVLYRLGGLDVAVAGPLSVFVPI